MSRKKESNWIRTFEVTNPTRHRKGFTVYKVISKVFPKTFPDGVTTITVWKRYSDFRKLHRDLRTIHQNLHLGGDFPEFAKAKAFGFGRFDRAVLEERQKSALILLDFAAKYSQLFTSSIFVKFFEHGYQIQELKVGGDRTEASNDKIDCLRPQRVSAGGDTGNNGDEDNVSISEGSSQDLSGVPTDTDSMVSSSILSAVDEVPNLLHPSHTIEFGSSTSEQGRSLESGTDCRSEVESHSEKSSRSQHSNADRLSMRTDKTPEACASSSHQKFVPNSKSCPSLDTPVSSTSILQASTSPPPPAETTRIRRRNLKPSWSLSIRRRPDGFAGFFDFLPIFPKKSEEKAVSDEKLLADSLNASYLCEAAGHFAVGQQQESVGDLESALEAYKEGITILLAGGQSDKNHKRRLLVRSKVEKYLNKAEELYSNLSKGNETNKTLFSTITIQNLLVPLPPSLTSSASGPLQPSPLEDLKNYRVVGTPAPGIILVVNVTEKVGPKCCAIKILRKSSDPLFPAKRTIIPTDVPFMVKLLKWFDTDSTIILLLQYAGGGRLEDFVSTYQTKPIAIIPHDVSPEENESGNRSEERSFAERESTVSVLAAFAEQLCNHNTTKVVDVNGNVSGREELCESYAQLFVDSDPDDPSDRGDKDVGAKEKKCDRVMDRKTTEDVHGVRTENSEASILDLTDAAPSPTSAKWGDVTVTPRSKRRNFASELKAGSFCTSLDASISWTNLEAVDTGDLIESAKVLIQTVSRTLTQCEADTAVLPAVASTSAATSSPLPLSLEATQSPLPGSSTNSSSRPDNDGTRVSFPATPGDTAGSVVESLSLEKQRPSAGRSETYNGNSDYKSRATETGRHKSGEHCELSTSIDPSETQFIKLSSTERLKEVNRGENVEDGRQGGWDCYSFKSQPSADELLGGEQILVAPEGREQMKLPGEDDDDGASCRTTWQESHYSQVEAHNGESDEGLDVTPIPIQRVVPECCIKVWMAEMVLALEKLHAQDLTYGDLSMNNILLGENGHILLSFTSQWAEVDHIPNCSDWLAPEVRDSFEIFSKEKIHFSADWWSLGAILLYLLTGKTVQSAHPEGLYANTVIKVWDKNLLGEEISQHAKSLMTELLQINPNLRLGYYGAAEVKSHPFFNGFDWDGALSGVQS